MSTITCSPESDSVRTAAVSQDDLAPAPQAIVRCRVCGEGIVVAWAPVISSHNTSDGVTSYLRCRCGGLGFAVQPRV